MVIAFVVDLVVNDCWVDVPVRKYFIELAAIVCPMLVVFALALLSFTLLA